MSWMVCGIRFLLWFLLLSSGSSLCSGSELDVRCLKTLQRSVIDPRGVLKSSWNFSSFICSFTGVECWNPGEERVLSLRLSNIGLEGQFPQGLENCAELSSLDLSGNNFSGPIPYNIWQLKYLTSLDLSYNSFSGEIPPNIANITFLNAVNLEHNQFSGQISERFSELGRLTQFNVSYNLLSGPIPLSLSSKFPPSCFASNQGLCGVPLMNLCGGTGTSNDGSWIPAAVGFVVGFVVAFYFPHLFVFSQKLRPYVVRIV